MLKGLREDLVKALQDVESELDDMGGSVSNVSVSTKKSVASTSKKSVAPSVASSRRVGAPSIAEE